jgi:formate C-acetyltransferase
MNERIKTLRELSLNTEETISIERARLLTEFYTSGEFERSSLPVARAKAFKFILEHKE